MKPVVRVAAARSLLPLAVAALAAVPARAQCADWSRPFGLQGIGIPSQFAIADVRDLQVHDDGTGPKLYVSGYFGSAGDCACRSVARWNGTSFEPVGAGLQYGAYAMSSVDLGSGPALYAGQTIGGSPSVHRWDGATWTVLPGLTYVVKDFAAYDDGSGPALYAASGQTGWIHRWDGTAWSLVGGGVNYTVEALAVFDDGTGPALYAAGDFSVAGNQPAYAIARWDGTSWTSVGGGLTNGFGQPAQCFGLAVWDDGTGRKLYACGDFAQAGGQSIANLAAWDGAQWSAVGSGVAGLVVRVEALQLPGGSVLSATGTFTHAGGTVVRAGLFDGAAWTSIGDTLESTALNEPWVQSFAVYDEGAGPRIFAAGGFQTAGGVPAFDLARFDGAGWSALGGGDGVSGSVRALARHDDGSGSALYAGGLITSVGDVTVRLVARWDGSAWSRVGTQAVDAGEVRALASVEFGAGPRLVAGGTFVAIDGVPARVAAWDGVAWSSIDAGAIGPGHLVNSLAVRDEAGAQALYAGGGFGPLGGVVRFDGASWSSLGFPENAVAALAFFDAGAGDELYAASGNRLYRLQSGAWSQIANGPGGSQSAILALAAHDDGATRALYVGGLFSRIGVVNTYHLARWDGAAWSTFGSGATGFPNGNVAALASIDDGLGGGARLYAGGLFGSIDGVPCPSVGVWDGSAWSSANGGASGAVRALASFDDGGGPSVFAGGDVVSTDLVPALGLARVGRHGHPGCAPTTGASVCDGSGSGAACPCANPGAVGRGCANASNASGARLAARGAANSGDDTVTLDVDGTRPSSAVLFFQGTIALAGGAGVAFGDGVRCIGGTQVRLAVRTASGGAASFGDAVPGDPSVSSAGGVHAPATRLYQAWYRDAAPGWCTPATFNLSNGLEIRWVR